MPDRYGLPDYVERPTYKVLQLPVDRSWSIAEYAIFHVLTKGAQVVPMEDGLGIVSTGTAVMPINRGSWVVRREDELFVMPNHLFDVAEGIHGGIVVRFNEPAGRLTRRYAASDGMEVDAAKIILDDEPRLGPVVNTTLAFLLRDHTWMVRNPDKNDRLINIALISKSSKSNRQTTNRIKVKPGHVLALSDTEGLQIYHPAAFAALFKPV